MVAVMGRSGKHRKRVRLLREHDAALAGEDKGGDVLGDDDGFGPVDPSDAAAAVRVMQCLAADPELLRSRPFKPLRSALHPVLEQLFQLRKAGGPQSAPVQNLADARRKRPALVDDSITPRKVTVLGNGTVSSKMRTSVTAPNQKALSSQSEQVTQALIARKWDTALVLLGELRDIDLIPKLVLIKNRENL